VTSLTDTARRFLEDAPPEIRDVLDWYGDGDAKEAPARDISDFAGKFLGALYWMGPLFPDTLQVSAPETVKTKRCRPRLSWQTACGVFVG
jgi:hypothetical protein